MVIAIKEVFCVYKLVRFKKNPIDNTDCQDSICGLQKCEGNVSVNTRISHDTPCASKTLIQIWSNNQLIWGLRLKMDASQLWPFCVFFVPHFLKADPCTSIHLPRCFKAEKILSLLKQTFCEATNRGFYMAKGQKSTILIFMKLPFSLPCPLEKGKKSGFILIRSFGSYWFYHFQ